MWSPSTPRERLAIGALGVIVLALVVLGVVAATASPPTLNEVTSSWGEVGENETIVESNVSVTNPNPYPIPSVIEVGARLRLNDVLVGPASPERVSFVPGNGTLTLKTALAHDRIPRWWPTHINNGEETRIRIEPVVRVPFMQPAIPNRTRTFETDILASFETDQPRTVRIDDRAILELAPLDASWGRATANTSPLTISTELTNPRDRPVAFDRLEYSVEMNTVSVASGATEPVRVPGHATEDLTLEIGIENRRLADWWPTHIENGERTQLNVTVVGVVTVDGERERVPLEPLSRRLIFETDLLESGDSSIETLESAPAPDRELPTLESYDPVWQAINDTATEIRATATLRNPNPESSLVTRLLHLDTSFEVDVNDVTLAGANRTGVELSTGDTALTIGDTIPGTRLERWWVSHINNDERSDRILHRRAIADLGFTSVTVLDEMTRRTVRTDALSGIELERPHHVTAGGVPIFTVSSIDASWGTATMDTTPVETTATVSNPSIAQATITRIEYRVSMNDVVLADGGENRSIEVPPGSTRTIAQRVPLDTDRIDRWWVTHLERDQNSTITVRYRVYLESGGRSYTMTFDELSTTFTTDFLKDEG